MVFQKTILNRSETLPVRRDGIRLSGLQLYLLIMQSETNMDLIRDTYLVSAKKEEGNEFTMPFAPRAAVAHCID